MKIIKEEKLEEYVCPNCNGALEFDCNEMVHDFKFFWLVQFWKSTENGWFECRFCNKRYLIEDYVLSKVQEPNEVEK
jgi:uncharacterized protein YbaR (Trm112 family)